ncbi:MAG: hypothetical protein R2844_16605 [Caldilineales bacterium]
MAYGMHKGRGFGMGWRGGFGRHGGNRSEMDAELAAVLGITVDELRTARDTAVANMIEKAVAEGELAPKEAERMTAARKLRSYVDPMALMAQVLGMTTEDVRAALDGGKTPWDLAAEQNLDLGTAWQKLMAAGKAMLDQAVADGVITREQADELFSRRGRGFFGKRGFGPGFMGGGFGRRHRHGGWGHGDDFLGGPPAVI